MPGVKKKKKKKTTRKEGKNRKGQNRTEMKATALYFRPQTVEEKKKGEGSTKKGVPSNRRNGGCTASRKPSKS